MILSGGWEAGIKKNYDVEKEVLRPLTVVIGQALNGLRKSLKLE